MEKVRNCEEVQSISMSHASDACTGEGGAPLACFVVKSIPKSQNKLKSMNFARTIASTLLD